MNRKKFSGALGFAMKAGKCSAGAAASTQAIKSGKAKLALVDSAASQNTIKRVKDACAYKGIECIVAEDIGMIIGKPGKMQAAVTDEGFAAMIKNACDMEDISSHGGDI